MIIFGNKKRNLILSNFGFFRNLENRQEFDVFNRDNSLTESLFKLNLPLKTSVKEVIQLISQRIEYPAEQIIIQKPSV